ncbi:MAG: hypothetical protein ACE5IY_21850 [bacterium]
MHKEIINWFVGPGRTYMRRFGGPIFLILAIAAALVVLYLNGKQVLTYSFHLNPALVLLSLGIAFSGLGFVVLAWHLILARFGSRLSYHADLRIYCYSILGSTIPGGIWQLAGRVALYERQGVAGIRVTVATVVEFTLLGLAGLTVYGFTILLQRTETFWQRPEFVLIAAALAFVLVQPSIFNKFIIFILQRSGGTDQPILPLRYRDLGGLLGLQVLTIVFGGSAIYVLLQSFVAVPIDLYITVVGAWGAGVAASNLLFWFPGKPVLRDGAMALVLAQALTPSLALIFVIVVRIWTIASIIIMAGLAWLFLRRESPLRTN